MTSIEEGATGEHSIALLPGLSLTAQFVKKHQVWGPPHLTSPLRPTNWPPPPSSPHFALVGEYKSSSPFRRKRSYLPCCGKAAHALLLPIGTCYIAQRGQVPVRVSFGYVAITPACNFFIMLTVLGASVAQFLMVHKHSFISCWAFEPGDEEGRRPRASNPGLSPTYLDTLPTPKLCTRGLHKYLC